MLDAQELSRRLIEAMDKHTPKITSTALAETCKVTPQAVNGWRKTGRLAKRHIPTIARLTGKPLEYFLGATPFDGDLGLNLRIEEAVAIKHLREAHPDWRRYVLSLALIDRQRQELMLATMREAVPDHIVEKAIGDAPHVAARKAKAQ